MAVLQLHNRMNSDALILPGAFIDFYIPVARGEDVKVYLYLLRMVSKPDAEVSLASLGDALECSQHDIVRSLTYWEKAGLLKLSFNSDHVLEAVSFLEVLPPPPKQTKLPELIGQDSISVSSGFTSASMPVTRQTSNVISYNDSLSQTASAQAASQQAAVSHTDALPAAKMQESGAAKRQPHDLTARELASLDDDFEFNAVVMMAEQCYGGPIAPKDADCISYWYINFDRSVSLMETLLEYCAKQCQPQRVNSNYLNKVAAGWFSEGITSAEQAREYRANRSSLIHKVMQAFGLKNKRDPNPVELESIRRWSKDYGFSVEMIELACIRTAAKTTKDQFAYAEGILRRWHDQHISTVAQAEEENLEFKKRNTAQKGSPLGKKASVEISKSAKQFHNFEERDTDYEALLLGQLRRQNQ